MTNVRIRQYIIGATTAYEGGSVQSLSSQAATDLINAGQAILEGPSPSGTVATLYANAGYTVLSPAPSGYISPSGWIADAPSGGGFYFPNPNDQYTLTVCFPGKRETTFDLMKMRPLKSGAY